jgi:hypothetical protein
MRVRQKISIAVATCIAGTALLLWIITSGTGPEKPNSSILPQQAATFPAPALPSNPSDWPATHRIDRPLSQLYLQQELATNLRAFVEQAKRQPEKGGLFLAASTIRICNTLAIQNKDTASARWRAESPAGPAALAAANQLAHRCEGFTQADLAEADRMLQRSDSSDPILTAARTLKEGRNGMTVDQWRTHLQILIDSGIPLTGRVMEDSLIAGSALLKAPRNETLYLNGQPYGGFSPEALRIATELDAPLYSDVDESNLRNTLSYLTRCALTLDCSVSDPVNAALASNPKLSRDEVVRARAAYQVAIQRDGAAALMPPSKRG